MRLGITGSEYGGTDDQLRVLTHYLRVLQWTELHHGDCEGVDAEAHDIAWNLIQNEGKNARIYVHPPNDDKKRAYKGAVDPHVWHEPELPYLERDRVVVMRSELLIVVPHENDEPGSTRGSGTWYTKKYADELRRPIRIIWPTGLQLGYQRLPDL